MKSASLAFTLQGGYHQENKEQQMLVEMLGNRNPYTPMAGLQKSPAPRELSVRTPQVTNIKNRTTIVCSYTTPG